RLDQQRQVVVGHYLIPRRFFSSSSDIDFGSSFVDSPLRISRSLLSTSFSLRVDATARFEASTSRSMVSTIFLYDSGLVEVLNRPSACASARSCTRGTPVGFMART